MHLFHIANHNSTIADIFPIVYLFARRTVEHLPILFVFVFVDADLLGKQSLQKIDLQRIGKSGKPFGNQSNILHIFVVRIGVIVIAPHEKIRFINLFCKICGV